MHAVSPVVFSIQQKVVISCAKNSPAVKKGKAKNAQVHVHGVTTTKRHDIKIWPRKHLQYRHFCAFIYSPSSFKEFVREDGIDPNVPRVMGTTVTGCCHIFLTSLLLLLLGPRHIQPSTYTNVATYPLGKYKQCHRKHSEQYACTCGNDTYAYVHRQGSLTGIRKPQY